jgi:glycosyltransferase involved in cell wall biosynthesis
MSQELAVMDNAQSLAFVNDEELRYAKARLPGKDMFQFIALPEAQIDQDLTERAKPQSKAVKLIIVASRNPANEFQVEWFLTKVWPHLLHLDVSLDVVGGIDSFFAGREFPKCKFLGPLDSLEKAYRAADIIVLPILIGGGIAIKTIEALLWEKPVTATLHAFRGLPVRIREILPHTMRAAAMVRDLELLVRDADARTTRKQLVREAAMCLDRERFYGELKTRHEWLKTLSLRQPEGQRLSNSHDQRSVVLESSL